MMRKNMFKAVALLLFVLTNINMFAQGDPTNQFNLKDSGDLYEALYKLGGNTDKYAKLSEIAINGINSCVPKNCTKGERQIFMCSDIVLPECHFTSPIDLVTQDFKLIVTGYWINCDGNMDIEIAEIIPQVPEGAIFDCASKLGEDSEYWAKIIKSAQLNVLTALANTKNDASIPNYVPTTELTPDNYNFYAKTCWKTMIIADYHDEWEYLEKPMDLSEYLTSEAVPINKSNMSNQSKTDELQSFRSYLTELVSCKESGCCKYTYSMNWAKDDKGKYYITSTQFNGSNTTDYEASKCKDGAINTDIGTCTMMCDKLLMDKNDNYPIMGKLSANVTPNPNTGQMLLTLNGEATGEMKFEITDVSGNLLFEKEMLNSSTEFTLELNVTNLINGNYYYRVLQNNTALVDGNIVIQK